MITLMFTMSAFFIILYNSTFARFRTRKFTMIAIFARVLSWAIFSVMVRSDLNPKLVKLLFLIQALVFNL